MVREFCTALGTLGLSGLSAQSDTIFPNVSGTWDMTTTTWNWDGTNMNFMYFQHHLEFDQSINEVVDGLEWGAVLSDVIGQIGWLAVSGRQVFYRGIQAYYYGYTTYDDTTTRVLYDFDLMIGDTTYFDELVFPVIVQGIDSVQLGGRTRVRFTLSNGDEWIMGMGSIQGLLRPLQYWFECIYELDAFCGEYMDADLSGYTACTPVVMSTEYRTRPEVSVYPVPCAGSFTIQGVDAGQPFRVIDATGGCVLAGTTAGMSQTIHLPNVINGAYLLEVNGHRTKLIIE